MMTLKLFVVIGSLSLSTLALGDETRPHLKEGTFSYGGACAGYFVEDLEARSLDATYVQDPTSEKNCTQIGASLSYACPEELGKDCEYKTDLLNYDEVINVISPTSIHSSLHSDLGDVEFIYRRISD